jgi:twitching motility protein PilI
MAASKLDPLELLQRMERAIVEKAPRLPEEAEGPALWTGIGFRLADLHLVAPLNQVGEVLEYPAITPVPGTKPWVRGIANVRGNLLTIIDMAQFFGREPIFEDERARALVINIEALGAALLVSEVFGLRHFNEELERQMPTLPEDDPVAPHLQGAFLRDDVRWGIFDMHSLAASSAFMHVAAA